MCAMRTVAIRERDRRQLRRHCRAESVRNAIKIRSTQSTTVGSAFAPRHVPMQSTSPSAQAPNFLRIEVLIGLRTELELTSNFQFLDLNLEIPISMDVFPIRNYVVNR